MKNLRIVFMGTPEFAVATLDALLIKGLNVIAVVTAPDKPSGRGRKMTESAVKEYAGQHQLQILQPVNLKDPEFIRSLKDLKPDLFIVVAFRMLPESVWKIPTHGTINLHASLLPEYRGAAPINHAIINGESVTGVTTFLIDDRIDTGNILRREEIGILPSDNAGDLHDRLMIQGAQLMIKTIGDIADDKIQPQPQSKFIKPGDPQKSAPKIHPDFCLINWTKSAVAIHNLIRGLSPYPCARSFFKNDSSALSFKVYESMPEESAHSYEPGHLVTDGKNYLKIACKDGFIHINTLQLEGKKKMKTVEFLRGFRISDYAVPVT